MVGTAAFSFAPVCRPGKSAFHAVEIYGRSMKPWAASSGRRYPCRQFTNQPAPIVALDSFSSTLAALSLLPIPFSIIVLSVILAFRVIPLRPSCHTCSNYPRSLEISMLYLMKHAQKPPGLRGFFPQDGRFATSRIRTIASR